MQRKSHQLYIISIAILLIWQVWRSSLWLPTDEEPFVLPPLQSAQDAPEADARTNLHDVPNMESSASITDHSPELPELCSHLPVGVSAAAFWKQHQERILQSTALSASHVEWMRRLFVTLSPDVLEQGLAVFPWLNTLKTSLKPLLQNETLRVGVMGGSVAEGRGCVAIPPAELGQYINKTEPAVDSRKCTWVHRLQMIATEFNLPIQIFNLATGGTNSFLALPVLQFQLYHSEILKELNGPHIVMNGYAPNDSLYSWSWNASENNATANYDHYRKAWEGASRFVSAAASSCKQKPLVVFVNDYYGNQHDRLLAEDIRSDAVRQVAQDSGHMYLSPVTALRPWVHANTRETLFSPQWWIPKRKTLEYIRDVHFGMPGHIAIAWSVAYSFLRVAIEYCDQMRSEKEILVEACGVSESTVLPLPLPWNTTFGEWQERMQQSKEEAVPQETCSAKGPCLFAFVANPAGTHRKRNQLSNYISTYQVSNTGWQAEDDIRNGWQNKLGLCAHSVGAELVLEFRNISQPVKTISLHSLKSYGPAWDDSVAQFHVTIRDSIAQTILHETSFEITGYHNQTTSITYPFLLTLPADGATAGTDLRIGMTLQQGSNFKITSLLLCDR